MSASGRGKKLISKKSLKYPADRYIIWTKHSSRVTELLSIKDVFLPDNEENYFFHDQFSSFVPLPLALTNGKESLIHRSRSVQKSDPQSSLSLFDPSGFALGIKKGNFAGGHLKSTPT